MPATRALTVALVLVAASLTACKEEGEIKVASLKFEGVSQVDKGSLANALKTKKGSRLPWGRKRYFDRRDFDADLKRIVAFYHDRGFPDARVASVDTNLNDDQTAIDVTVRITEGEPIRVAEVVLEGFDVLPQRPLRRLRRQLPLQAGQPIDRQLATTSRERAVNAFRDNGYPYAVVRLINEPVAERQEKVVLRATPGTLAHFGPVEITGQASVNDHIIRRQLVFDAGDEFSQQKLKDSQRKLYGLELFQFVNIETVEGMAQEQPAEVPIRVTLAESKHKKITFSAGYGSEEHLRGRVRWDHVNFLGNARHLGLEARWSSLDRGVRAEFREPYFFNPRMSLSFEGQWWNAEEPVYSQKTAGGRAVVRHQWSERLFMSVSVINEFQTSTITEEARNDPTVRDELISLGLDPRTGESSGTVGAIAFDIGRNTTNNLLDARRGYVLNVHYEEAGGALWGSYNYRALGFEARYFLNLGNRMVVATRLSGGALDPHDNLDANIPFHKRFFLGGASSNRGWGRFEISPLEAGLPIGGLTMLDGSTELRVPLFGKLGAVAFVDYANVWETAWSADIGDLRYAVGPGLRYQTPIGPARIDLGYQLTPIEGLLVDGEAQKREWRVHFSVGQAF